ncbi:unnamed protein product [Sphenostylis stenocarpa]|uniref:Uncharacterized protein n=1 Tax=Sphenostylis stenocarpa TaxID=92480 RepID=A0AA86SD60_9FABA|nr:unnamed protein product [Sphenostylis stenocarpa]
MDSVGIIVSFTSVDIAINVMGRVSSCRNGLNAQQIIAKIGMKTTKDSRGYSPVLVGLMVHEVKDAGDEKGFDAKPKMNDE